MWKPKAVTVVVTVTASAILGAGTLGALTSPTTQSLQVTPNPTQTMSEAMSRAVIARHSFAMAEIGAVPLRDAFETRPPSNAEPEFESD